MLTINLATRGRPDRLIDTVTRTLPNLARDDTKFVISIDEDDEGTIAAIERLPSDGRVIPYVRPREDALGEKWNRALDFPADVYMPMADYTPYITPGFDQLMLDAAGLFPDGIGVVYTRMANLSFPITQGITHKLVAHLGFMYPPYFPYWFVDHWIDDIAKLIDRISFADVVAEIPANKIPTQEMREVHWWASFFDSMRLMRRRQARAIIDSDAFEEPEWRKEVLRRHHPLIEYRSQAINDHVRSWIEKAALPGGERYARVKAKAAEMMKAEWPLLAAELEGTCR